MKNKNERTGNRASGPRLLPLVAALITAFSALHAAPPAQAQAVMVTGDVRPAGPNPPEASWSVDGSLNVGLSNVGTMTIMDGGVVSSATGGVGNYQGGNSIVTVSGRGSRWTTSGYLAVGGSGTGTLNIKEGATVSSGSGMLASFPLGNAIVTVSGKHSSWGITDTLSVGTMGTAILTIEDGGTVSSRYLLVGGATPGYTSSGTMQVSGKGSLLQSGGIYIGGEQTATLSIEDGGVVSNASSTLGSSSREKGSATVTGGGSRWSLSGALHIGLSGTGTLTVEKGARVEADSITIASSENAAGTLDLLGDAVHGRGVVATGELWNGSGVSALNLNGGILEATKQQYDYFYGFNSLTVGSEGAWFNSNGHDIGIGTTLSSASSSSLNKLGAGTLTLRGDSSNFLGDTNVEEGKLAVAYGGKLAGRNGYIGTNSGKVGSVSISTRMSSWVNTGELVVGHTGSGALDVSGGAMVAASQASIGGRAGSQGAVTLSDNGSLSVDGGAGDMVVARSAGSTAKLNIGAASTDASAANGAGKLQAARILFGAGDGSLNFNHNALAYDFGGSLRSQGLGKHQLNQYSGQTRLTGDSSGFQGLTSIQGGVLTVANVLGGSASVTGGRLQVDGRFDGPVSVAQLGSLAGQGTVAGNVILTGGALSGLLGQTLTIGGNLTLDPASRVNVQLNGAPANTLFDVRGNLALNGTLNVDSFGGFGAGAYRVFDYGGVLSGNGLTVGSTPFGLDARDFSIQTGVSGQVNLVSTANTHVVYWDGGDTTKHDNGVVDGGSGSWDATNRNWTNANGTSNGLLPPNPTFVVFQGTAGYVWGNSFASDFGMAGMQIATDGYHIQGIPLALQGESGETIIRVGTGLASSAGMSGTISAPLTGASKLVKSDYGTLVLTAYNRYTGGTEIRGGVLSVNLDANLGEGGDIILNGGTLRTTADFDTARAVLVQQASGIDVPSSSWTTLKGNVSGPGELIKYGSGTLTLTGVNSYSSTRVEAGTLVGNAASIRGNLLNYGAVRFEQLSDADFNGHITGTGQMTKAGTGTLTLSGASQLPWHVLSGTIVSGGDRYSGNTFLDYGSSLRLDDASSATYAGAMGGSGTFTKTGTGRLQLTNNSVSFYGNTQVNAGTLQISGVHAGNITVTDANLQVDGVHESNADIHRGTLSGSGTIYGATRIWDGILAGEQGQTLKLNGGLHLDSGSHVNVALGGAPSTALFDVGTNLILDGTLNVKDQGGFGAGVYRLFDYRGGLIDNGLTVGATPVGVSQRDLSVQTAVPGQVNLASTGGVVLSFWDGGNVLLHDNGQVNGGTGFWTADGRNWTDANGAVNGPLQPTPTFTVFQGAAGTVTVDASAGPIGVTGMQIASDGYRIQGDPIALQGAGGESIVRVGTGAVDSAGVIGTIASALTGASKLVKADYGTLVLAGNNSYSGGTEIRSGMLSIASDANLGAAWNSLNLNGGTLATTANVITGRAISITQDSGIAVAAATALGVTGPLSGNASLTKLGAGTLMFSGDGSAYTGRTVVQSGALNVSAQSTLAGPVTVASGAMLQGSGQVGATTVQSGAVLAPNHTGGPLRVAGDLRFLPGSMYQVSADPDAATSASVTVNGTANLAGSVVHVGPEGGFESARQYTILTARAVQGQFGTVSSNYAYLNPALRYGAQDVTLQLERKQTPVDPGTPTRPITFADKAQAGNQRAVANALDSLPASNALHEYILTLPEGAPPTVFNSLSGEAHASVTSSLANAGSTTRTLPLSHLRANLGAGMRPGAPTAQAGGELPVSSLPSSNAQPAWAELVGNWQTQQGNGNAAQVKQHTGGVFVGADHAVGGGWRLGGALGYTDGKIRVDDRASKADVSSYSAALYGGKSFQAGAGKLNLMAGASYTWHDIGTERRVAVAGAQQKLTADYGASTTQLFTELGYAILLSERASIEPFAGLAWSDLRSRAFSESGGLAALRGQSSSDKQTSSTLGVRAQTDFTLGRAEGRLQATLGWRHAFGDVVPQSTMAFDGGQAFTVAGTPIARNAALAELGVDVAVSRSATLGLNYSGQYGGGNREHAGAVSVRWRY